MTTIVNHPTAQQVIGLNCVDMAHGALENITGLTALLHRITNPGPPLDVSELWTISNTLLRDADRLDTAFALWGRLPADRLPKRLGRDLQRQVDALRQQADDLGHAALLAECGTPPTAGQLAAFVSCLQTQREALHQALIAADAACIARQTTQPRH